MIEEVAKMHSEEAEVSILGGLMLDSDSINKCVGLEPDHFFFDHHKELFEAIKFLTDNGAPADPLTTAHRLEESGTLISPLDMGYLTELVMNVAGIANIGSYSKIVIDFWTRRQAYQAGSMIMSAASAGLDNEKLIELAQEKTFNLSKVQESERKTFFSPKEAVLSVSASIQSKLDGKGLGGFKIGLSDIDKRVDGFVDGDLIVVGARPSMGKTTYGLQCVLGGCYQSGKRAFIFSLESTEEQMFKRAICSLGTIRMDAMKTAQLDEGEWGSFVSVSDRLAKSQIFIDSPGRITASDIRNRARRYAEEYGKPDVIMVDHLKQIKKPGKNAESETGEAVAEMKDMALELGCPVILLAQLNRSLEQRNDKRPQNSDLRDSGQIEEIADIIQFLYRDEVYNEDSDHKGVMEIITAKYRDGEIGTDKVAFIGKYNQIKDLTYQAFSSDY